MTRAKSNRSRRSRGRPRDDYLECLKPPPPTPSDEMCRCRRRGPFVLIERFGQNPVACAKCRGEIEVQKLGVTWREAQAIASWRQLYSSIKWLWLQSGAYENWASSELASRTSAVNRMGLDLRRMLGHRRLTYLYWFHDNEGDPDSEMKACPLCGGRFRPLGRFIACARCRIARG
ncbi:MAG: DUF2310 family Zn-ribbon-containing protein [Planctomycetes bacterium]|nr:DUF2310 family Zn-ribbon-containing protein [Planctomycetota bacterium]